MASIKKRGASWSARVSFYDALGKRHTKRGTFKTKKEAEYFASQNELSKGRGDDILGSTKTFVQYFTEWYETYKEPSVAAATKRNYLFTVDKLKASFNETKIGDITRTVYQMFLNDLADTYAHETVAKIAGHCRACAIDAVEDGVIHHNFTTRTTIPKCVDYEAEVGNNYLDASDMAKLKAYIRPKISINNMSAAMILVSMLSGLRYSEVAGLTWSDIDYTANTLRVNKTLDYKGDGDFLPTKTKASNRTVSIPADLVKLIGGMHQDQVAAGIQNDLHLIFIGTHGTKVPTDNAVNKALRTAHEKLGIKKITFHGLRHTHASYLLYKNVSIYVISQRLGHSDVGITQRVYAHVIAELHTEQSEIINDALESI